eukprot:103046-Pyramimonas_sp.AAC.1
MDGASAGRLAAARVYWGPPGGVVIISAYFHQRRDEPPEPAPPGPGHLRQPRHCRGPRLDC